MDFNLIAPLFLLGIVVPSLLGVGLLLTDLKE